MQTFFSYLQLAWKQLWRHRLRSILTLSGAVCGLFVVIIIETAQLAVYEQTAQHKNNEVLVVYRENRFCPFSSRLPEYYQDQMEQVAGVKSVVPVKVVVNNCRTSLDVITFRGFPTDDYQRFLAQHVKLIDGSLDTWMKEDDGALIGAVLAKRRRLAVGDAFNAAGLTVRISGIIDSQRSEDQDVAYVHLPFLQRFARGDLGEVTQFTVEVEEGYDPLAVAKNIDMVFQREKEPTSTRPQNAFFTYIASDLIEMVTFTRWVGLGALMAVIILLLNAMFLSMRGRVREFAILACLGFRREHIGIFVLLEGMILGALAAFISSLAAWVTLNYAPISITSEGLNLLVTVQWPVIGMSFFAGPIIAAIASLVPAILASKTPIITSLRMR